MRLRAPGYPTSGLARPVRRTPAAALLVLPLPLPLPLLLPLVVVLVAAAPCSKALIVPIHATRHPCSPCSCSSTRVRALSSSRAASFSPRGTPHRARANPNEASVLAPAALKRRSTLSIATTFRLFSRTVGICADMSVDKGPKSFLPVEEGQSAHLDTVHIVAEYVFKEVRPFGRCRRRCLPYRRRRRHRFRHRHCSRRLRSWSTFDRQVFVGIIF